MIGLKIELVERRYKLSNGANALIGHVDTVIDGQRGQPRMKAGPQSLLGDFIATGNLQFVESLEKLRLRELSVKNCAE